jgi:hypothetical protein
MILENFNGDLPLYCVKSPFILIVIPGLTRNQVLLNWIPAFAGMTAPELMQNSVRRITMGFHDS